MYQILLNVDRRIIFSIFATGSRGMGADRVLGVVRRKPYTVRCAGHGSSDGAGRPYQGVHTLRVHAIVVVPAAHPPGNLSAV